MKKGNRSASAKTRKTAGAAKVEPSSPATKSYAGAAWNQLMENESKYSIAELYLDSLDTLRQWATWGVIEVAVRNPNVSSFVTEKEAEIARLTARHAALAGALREIADLSEPLPANRPRKSFDLTLEAILTNARTALAEGE